MGALDRLILDDAQWERMAPHIIGDERSRGSSGRNNRLFVEGVLWIVRTGSPWDDVKNSSQIWAVAPALVKLVLRDDRRSQFNKEPPWKRIAKGLF